MTDRLIREIKSIGNFSDEEIELFFSYLTEDFIPKGEHFLKEGQISYHLAYITSGLAMHYRTYEGVEIPIEFSAEGSWMAYLKSFTNGTPADVEIKALEDTQILRPSAAGLKELFLLQPKFMALRNYYTEIAFMATAQHTTDLAILDAKQKYRKFMQERPDLINRVPQYYIAAYLGIKPQSLSRIRKEG